MQQIEGWELFPECTILDTPVVSVSAGPVKCKRSGHKADFYKFHFPQWVNVVAVTQTGDLVLVRQFRYGTARYELEIPGGVVHDGECPVKAGCRELKEETGYIGKNARIIGKVCPNPALQGNTCYTVLVEAAELRCQPELDDMEDVEVLLKAPDRVYQLVREGRIDHGLVLNALMFYKDGQSG